MSINSRELRTLERELHGHVHPAVMKCMLKLVDENHAMRQMIMQLASLFDQLVNNQIAQARAVKAMRDQLPHMRKLKEMGMEVGSDATLTGEHDET